MEIQPHQNNTRTGGSILGCCAGTQRHPPASIRGLIHAKGSILQVPPRSAYTAISRCLASCSPNSRENQYDRSTSASLALNQTCTLHVLLRFERRRSIYQNFRICLGQHARLRLVWLPCTIALVVWRGFSSSVQEPPPSTATP